MDTHKLERIDESSRLIGATSWAAIASGVFIALALQIVLLLFGLAFGVSVGDRNVGGGYALWAMLVQLAALAVGGALAARISNATRLGGALAGVLTWAVSLVLGGALQGLAVGLAVMQRSETAGAWAAFFGATLGLGAAIVGGIVGASYGRTTHPTATTGPSQPLEPIDPIPRPVKPEPIEPIEPGHAAPA